MNQEQFDQLQTIFNEVDTNGSGFIDRNQLGRLVAKITNASLEDKEEELDTLMKSLDTDGDGKLAFEEFVKGYAVIHSELEGGNNHDDVDDEPIDEQKIEEILKSSGSYTLNKSQDDYEHMIRSIFNSFDTDNDGVVNMEQLREMLIDIKTKSGIEGDDQDDIDYIVGMFSDDGASQTATGVNFNQFMSAIQHITAPNTQESNADNTGDSTTDSSATTNAEDSEEQANNTSNEDTSTIKVRGRASSWVTPVSIAQMIKKRSAMIPQETEVFTEESIAVDQAMVDQLRRKEAMLKQENQHLGTKIVMVEDQLRQVKEAHEKLSDDNALLKKTVISNRKTLAQNEKLGGQVKQLEEAIEQVKQELKQSSEQRAEVQRQANKLKQEKEVLNGQLDAGAQELSAMQAKVKSLEAEMAVVVAKLSAANDAAATAAAATPEVSIDELNGLKEENKGLRDTMQRDAETAQQSLKQLTEQLQQVQSQSAEEKAQVESSSQSTIAQLQTIVQQQKDDIEQRTQSGAQQQNELSQAQQRAQQLETQLQQHQTELDTLRQKHAQELAQVQAQAQLTQQQSQDNGELTQTRQRAQELETQLGAMRQQHSQELDTLRQQHAQQLAVHTQQQARLQQLESTHGALQAENETLKTQLAGAQGTFDTQRKDYEARLGEMRNQVKSMQHEQQQQQHQQKQVFEVEEDSSNTRSLRARIDELSSKLQNERDLNKFLQSQLDGHGNRNDDEVPLISHNNYARHNRQCCGLC
ncbi:hypothetical protein SAMD00019534_084440 [Acytostelium subglobosum LB1]|uniref:hypothetical protein n=1 Tax=Acytostelium subglobosum LB1 TaxID=1410327 RepID=UPI000644E2A3|nr:hypothetical protein SAMD00019534_084440 [Acytostelium subglobosum LB1]GAM25269.1 hypothetical protein SAMD00019534_084440 [Acytostelium subglobosum LB1]|eukprot:XP_012751789.1 hypothetical protein SAMD00019534_084440 [Acytostelium subglobosum LB1]